MKMHDIFQVICFQSFVKLKRFFHEKIEIAVELFKVILSAVILQYKIILGIMTKYLVNGGASLVEIKSTGCDINGLGPG